VQSFEQLKSMVVFAHIIDQGNLSAAAKYLGLSRAVVSYHLKKLEAELGVKLLNRSTRSMVLTEPGKIFYQRCKTVTEQATLAKAQMENSKNEPEGLIKITCPVNVGLELIVPAFNAFKDKYQKIDLDINLTDDVVNILQDGIDLAIRGAPLDNSDLQATRLITLSNCLCASPEYLKQHDAPKSPAELNAHQWVVYSKAAKVMTLSKGDKSYSISPTGSITTNNAAARTAFVVAGHGIGRIPEYDATPKIEQGLLERLFDDYQLPDIHVYGVFPSGTASNKKLRVLIDHLKEYFRYY